MFSKVIKVNSYVDGINIIYMLAVAGKDRFTNVFINLELYFVTLSPQISMHFMGM